MKVYIAGKISGDPKYRKKFSAAARKLARKGHVVLNPAVLPAGLTNGECAKLCHTMMDIADTIAFLPDARDSKGALLEYALLCYCQDKNVLYL
jgi:hypothetical protein